MSGEHYRKLVVDSNVALGGGIRVLKLDDRDASLRDDLDVLHADRLHQLPHLLHGLHRQFLVVDRLWQLDADVQVVVVAEAQAVGAGPWCAREAGNAREGAQPRTATLELQVRRVR